MYSVYYYSHWGPSYRAAALFYEWGETTLSLKPTVYFKQRHKVVHTAATYSGKTSLTQVRTVTVSHYSGSDDLSFYWWLAKLWCLILWKAPVVWNWQSRYVCQSSIKSLNFWIFASQHYHFGIAMKQLSLLKECGHRFLWEYAVLLLRTPLAEWKMWFVYISACIQKRRLHTAVGPALPAALTSPVHVSTLPLAVGFPSPWNKGQPAHRCIPAHSWCLLWNKWGNIRNSPRPWELYFAQSDLSRINVIDFCHPFCLPASELPIFGNSPLYKLVGNESKTFTMEAETQILSLLLHGIPQI